MKENKKIEKELLFKNNIKDITSISLDSDYKKDKSEINGNFIVSGEYKIHEVSLNKEKFNFKIPFKHELDNDIDMDTVKVEITNFEYDYKKDELIVNIEYDILGDKKDVLIFDDEQSLDEFLSSREVEVVDTRIDEIKEELIKEEPKKNNLDIKKETVEELKIEEKALDKTIEEKIEVINELEDRLEVETEEIINNIGNIEDGFVTYKIYKIKENETLESIVIKYKTTIEELKEYNDLNNLSINDKIIIPQYE